MMSRRIEKQIMFKAPSRATRCSPRLNPACIDLLVQAANKAASARRNKRSTPFDEVAQAARSEHNILTGPVRVPIEIFHRIASLLPCLLYTSPSPRD